MKTFNLHFYTNMSRTIFYFKANLCRKWYCQKCRCRATLGGINGLFKEVLNLILSHLVLFLKKIFI